MQVALFRGGYTAAAHVCMCAAAAYHLGRRRLSEDAVGLLVDRCVRMSSLVAFGCSQASAGCQSRCNLKYGIKLCVPSTSA